VPKGSRKRISARELVTARPRMKRVLLWWVIVDRIGVGRCCACRVAGSDVDGHPIDLLGFVSAKRTMRQHGDEVARSLDCRMQFGVVVG